MLANFKGMYQAQLFPLIYSTGDFLILSVPQQVFLKICFKSYIVNHLLLERMLRLFYFVCIVMLKTIINWFALLPLINEVLLVFIMELKLLRVRLSL